jgi:hypothetical protein
MRFQSKVRVLAIRVGGEANDRGVGGYTYSIRIFLSGW